MAGKGMLALALAVVLTLPSVAGVREADSDGHTTDASAARPSRFRALREELVRRHPRLARGGRSGAALTGRTLDSMLVFYAAEAVATGWKCYRENDPTICRAWLASLEDPITHGGFLAFALTSEATGAVLLRALGERPWVPLASKYLGLAFGSLANEVFVEYLNHPRRKQMLEAEKIVDPEERARRKAEARDKLLDETVLSSDWYWDKVPSLATLIGASFLAERSHSVLRKTSAGAARMLARSSPVFRLRCWKRALAAADRQLARTRRPPTLGERARDWIAEKPESLASLLQFMAWASALRYAVEPAWDWATLDGDLSLSRAALAPRARSREDEEEKFFAEIRRPAKQVAPTLREGTLYLELEADELGRALDEHEKLWDRYRQARLRGASEILAPHRAEADRFSRELTKAHLFYSWFVDGFETEYEVDGPDGKEIETDLAWEALRERTGWNSPDSAEVRRETARYLRAFFCGVPPEEMVRESRALHGLPIPTRWNARFRPFRVVPIEDPECATASDETLAKWKKRIVDASKQISRDGGYRRMLANSWGDAQAHADDNRETRVEAYRARVEPALRKALTAEGFDGKGLPLGVLGSFDAELEDLDLLRQRIQDPVALETLELHRSNIQEERQAALDLLAYLDGEEVAGIGIVDEILGLGQEGEIPEETYRKAIQFYELFRIE